MENYLSHHGVKGQRWGVRRYQNKDGTLTSLGKQRRAGTELVLNSGQTLTRITTKDDDSIKAGMYYSSNSKQTDVDKYVGLYAHFMKKSGKSIVRQTLQINGELVMPTHKKSVSLMRDALDSLNLRTDSNKQNALRKHFKETDVENASEEAYFRKGAKEFEDYVRTGNVGDNLYDCLNVDLAFRSSPIMQDIAKSFYSTCDKNGYGIIKDINDSKYGDMNATLPIILTSVGKVKMIDISDVTDDDIANARKRLGKRIVSDWDSNSPI